MLTMLSFTKLDKLAGCYVMWFFAGIKNSETYVPRYRDAVILKSTSLFDDWSVRQISSYLRARGHCG